MLKKLIIDQFSERNQNFLDKLSEKHGETLKELCYTPEYDKKSETIDFTNTYFPNLEILKINCIKLKTISFTEKNTPNLKILEIINIYDEIESFNITLKFIKSMDFQFLDIKNLSNFSKSLNSCPNLKLYCSYKLNGFNQNSYFKLNLPEIKTFQIIRSESLQGLVFNAPNLENLSVRSCYTMKYLALKEVCNDLIVDVRWTDIDERCLEWLENDERVLFINDDDVFEYVAI